MAELVTAIGVLQSGKSYYIDSYFKNRADYEIVSFADPLRELTWQFLNWKPSNDVEYENFKISYITLSNGNKITGRQLLQNIGESMRVINSNFWIELWHSKAFKLLNSGISVGCADCRYANELTIVKELILEFSGKIVFCNYQSENRDMPDTHSSEQLAQYITNSNIYKHLDVIYEIKPLEFVFNMSTLEDLIDKFTKEQNMEFKK